MSRAATSPAVMTSTSERHLTQSVEQYAATPRRTCQEHGLKFSGFGIRGFIRPHPRHTNQGIPCSHHTRTSFDLQLLLVNQDYTSTTHVQHVKHRFVSDRRSNQDVSGGHVKGLADAATFHFQASPSTSFSSTLTNQRFTPIAGSTSCARHTAVHILDIFSRR